MIFINEEKVLSLLNWDKTFQAVEVAMRRLSENQVVQSARTRTSPLDTNNLLLTMPAYLKDNEFGALACKIVSFFPNNVKLPNPLDAVYANIMYFDEPTGILKAIIAGTEITKWRTAAASAVATKYVYVNNSRPCGILAIFGAGHQGKVHAEAFFHFFNFLEIRICNRTTEKAKKLAKEFNKKYNTNIFISFDNNEDCVRGADVIITTTNSSLPIIESDWVKPGAHINAVGAGKTHHSEVDEKLYLNSDVYIDHWEGARKELAGLEKAGVKFKGEIGKVIIGDLKTAVDANRTTIFASLGMGVEDCAMARLVYDMYTVGANKL